MGGQFVPYEEERDGKIIRQQNINPSLRGIIDSVGVVADQAGHLRLILATGQDMLVAVPTARDVPTGMGNRTGTVYIDQGCNGRSRAAMAIKDVALIDEEARSRFNFMYKGAQHFTAALVPFDANKYTLVNGFDKTISTANGVKLGLQ